MIHATENLTPRARRRAQRKRSILDTAMTLLIEEGLDGLTIHRLAKRLDLTPGALYRYFPSKDAIIVELEIAALESFEQCFAQAFERARDLARSHQLPDAQRVLLELRVAVAVFLELSRERSERFHLISTIMSDPRTLVEAEAAIAVITPSLRLFQAIASRIEALVTHDELQPGNALQRAVLLWSALLGVTQVHKLSRFDADLFHVETLARNLLVGLLAGWGSQPQRLDGVEPLLAELRELGPLVEPEDDDDKEMIKR